jgi:ABC-type transport system involved in multi-copper enzyme maturation permease subunit
VNVRGLNPVLDLELRQRSRTLRSPLVVLVFLLLLTGVLFLTHAANSAMAEPGDVTGTVTGRIGRSMFEWVLLAELAIVLFLVPAISAGSIAGERARQTLIPLQVTLIRPHQIFLGKVLASSAFVLLLLVASAPVMAVPLLLGGITLGQVVASLVTLLVSGVLVAVIGVGCSAVFRRTQVATIMAYLVVVAMTIGTGIAVLTVAVIEETRGTDEATEPRLSLFYPNPYIALAEAAGDVDAEDVGPFTPVKRAFDEESWGDGMVVDEAEALPLDMDATRTTVFVDEFDDGPGVVVEEETGGSLIPIWVRSILAQMAIASVLAVIGIRRLRAPQPELTAP